MKNLMHTGNAVNTQYLYKIEGGESAELTTPLVGLENLKKEIKAEGIYKAMQEHATEASTQELLGHLSVLRQAFPNDDLETVALDVTMNVSADGRKVSFVKDAPAPAAQTPTETAKAAEVKTGVDYASLVTMGAKKIDTGNRTLGQLLNNKTGFNLPKAEVWKIVNKLTEEGANPGVVRDGDSFQFVIDNGLYYLEANGETKFPLTEEVGEGPNMDALP